MLVESPIEANATLLGDPRWFPHDYDPQRRRLKLLHAERAYWASKRFLDERWLTEALPQLEISIDDLEVLVSSGGKPQLEFIWHTAFCCSTLLADLLEKPGCNLSLREPQVLVKLAAARGGATAAAPLPYGAVLHLLARRFDGDAHVTVKPSNLANVLIEEVAARSEGKMLFLYSDLPTFLLAIARKKDVGRTFGQRLFARLAAEGLLPSGLSPQTRLSGAKIAALAWHMQTAMFARMLAVLGPSRAASLDCDDLLSAPRATLLALDAFFALGLGEAHIESAINGPLMSRHAKELRVFDAQTRKAENAALRARLGPDFNSAIAWSQEICGTQGPLAHPLRIDGTSA